MALRSYVLLDKSFSETINSARYIEIFNKFLTYLSPDEICISYFQQDNGNPHVSKASLEKELYPKNLYLRRSPDFTHPNYFLWSYLKRSAYKKNRTTLKQLKQPITDEINSINKGIFEGV